MTRRGRVRSAVGPGPENGLAILFRLFVAVVCVIGLRLVWLHVIVGPDNAQKAAQAHTISVTLQAKRGTIYDRNGNVLAMSVEAKTVYCHPHQVSDVEEAARILSQDLGGDIETYRGILTQDEPFVYIERKADKSTAEQLMADLREAEITGIDTITDSKRMYPYGRVAGQILGFVGVDGEGLTGLEFYYDDILRGEDGEMVMEIGLDGTPVAGGVTQIRDAKDGTDIIISIDVNIQQHAEDAIEAGVERYGALSGSVMIMNPKNGEVLACCSTPFVDLSHPSTITDEGLRVKPITDSYEPGSIFKVLTLAAGVDTGVLSPTTVYSVPAEVQVGDDMVHDDDLRDYALDMDVREIMRRSSNTGAVLMSNTIGSDAFAAYVDAFGIGHKTGIDFPGEAEGIVTPREEYMGNTRGAMSFGHAVAIPMDQMVVAVGAVANGGFIVTPHFLIAKDGVEVDWPVGEQILTPETCITVTDVLRSVATEGTAMKAQVSGFDLAAKTGTAEMVDIEHGGYTDTSLCSLIGYANAGDADVICYVGLNGIRYLAADSAAPVFSTIMSDALYNAGVQPVG